MDNKNLLEELQVKKVLTEVQEKLVMQDLTFVLFGATGDLAQRKLRRARPGGRVKMEVSNNNSTHFKFLISHHNHINGGWVRCQCSISSQLIHLSMQLKGSIRSSFTQSHSHMSQRHNHSLSSHTDSHGPRGQGSVFTVSKRDRWNCALIVTAVAEMNISWRVAKREVPEHRVGFS